MSVDVEAFYRKYGPMVLRRCRSILNNDEKAMDAMQDVFVQILKRKERLNNDAPSSLLYTTATNVCLNILRSEKRKPETQSDEILEIIAGSDNVEKSALTKHFLDRLFLKNDLDRVIAVLHYVDKLTLEETAKQVGFSVSGIRKRLRNLREKSLKLKEI